MFPHLGTYHIAHIQKWKEGSTRSSGPGCHSGCCRGPGNMGPLRGYIIIYSRARKSWLQFGGLDASCRIVCASRRLRQTKSRLKHNPPQGGFLFAYIRISRKQFTWLLGTKLASPHCYRRHVNQLKLSGKLQKDCSVPGPPKVGCLNAVPEAPVTGTAYADETYLAAGEHVYWRCIRPSLYASFAAGRLAAVLQALFP